MSTIESKLLAIFQLVNDWLKYAEAKNAGLVVASGAGSAAILTYLGSAQKVPPGWKNWLFTSLFFFMVSGAVSLISFVPRVNRSHWIALMHQWGNPEETDNLYYYRDLCKYERDSLVGKIKTRYEPTDELESKSQEPGDIADQIIVNSRIATVKFRLFTVAVMNILIAASIIIIGLIIDAFSHMK
jgi:hypothetical protein